MEAMDDLTLFVIDNHNEAKITTLNTYHYFQSVFFVGVSLYHSHRSVGVIESKLDWHEIWWNWMSSFLGGFLFLCEHGLHSYAVNQVMRLKTRSPWKQFGVAGCFYIRVCFVLWHHVQAFQFHSKLICSRHLSLIVNTLPHWRAVCRVTFLWNQAWTVQKSSRSCTNCWADVCSFAALVPCNQKWWRQQALLLTRRTFLQ